MIDFKTGKINVNDIITIDGNSKYGDFLKIQDGLIINKYKDIYAREFEEQIVRLDKIPLEKTLAVNINGHDSASVLIPKMFISNDVFIIGKISYLIGINGEDADFKSIYFEFHKVDETNLKTKDIFVPFDRAKELIEKYIDKEPSEYHDDLVDRIVEYEFDWGYASLGKIFVSVSHSYPTLIITYKKES
jgi:hypothetical protein